METITSEHTAIILDMRKLLSRTLEKLWEIQQEREGREPRDNVNVSVV